MRTILILTACSLSAALSAQQALHSNEPLPPRAEEATTPAPTDPISEREALARTRSIAAQPRTRVLFDRPRADGPLWAIGTSWKASFDGRGFTAIPFFGSTAPHNYPVRFELAQATVGGEALVLADGAPVALGNQVRTERGALTEVIDAGLEQLEQSFVFGTLPNRGAIAVDVNVTSELAMSPLANGLRFRNELGHLDYTNAVAVDAAGKRLPLAITWNGASAHIEIPAAFVEQAQLPIVLDPVLNAWSGIASGQTLLQHDSDVASFQSLGGRTLIIYQRQYSGNDQDCWGVMFDGNLGLVQTDFIIDFTTEDWTKVAVAANNYAQNFLVVSEIRIQPFLSSLYYIGGRTIAANAALGSVFDIERDGVVGIGGHNYHPDVGSDPYYGVGRYTVVFAKDSGANSGIYMRQITTAGGQVTTNPVALDITNAGTKPSISKSCGQSNGQPAYWMATWQRTYQFAPYDQDVFGRYINWNGALPSAVFTVAYTGGQDTAPSPSSPIDVDGTRYWPVCNEYAASSGQPRDIVCRVFRSDMAFVSSFTVSNNVPGSDDREPEMDSDGTRFVTFFTVGTTGYPQSIQAVTAAYLPGTNSFRVDERTGLLTSSLDNNGQCNVCADFSGGGTSSPRYFLCYSEQSTNTFRLVNFGGWFGGQFFVPRSSQCGTTTLAVTGIPVIGQTLSFNVAPGPLAAVHIGFPSFIPLNSLGCNCFQGVDPVATFVSPWVWNIPNAPAAVGLALSAQGFHITGTMCLGFIDLSDTIDFTIR